MQPDEEIVFPQDDLYTKNWETHFGEELATRGNETIPTSLPNGERLVTSDADSSDTHENEADYIITRDDLNDINDAAQRQNERLNDDVSRRKEATEAEKGENSDWLDSAVYPKNKEKSFQDLSEFRENVAIFSKRILLKESMHKVLRKGRMILSYQDRNENQSTRGRKYNLRPNAYPNY